MVSAMGVCIDGPWPRLLFVAGRDAVRGHLRAGHSALRHACLQGPDSWWQGVMRYEGGCGPVTALCVTAEQCIAAGTATGALLVFAPDPRRRLTRRVRLAVARAGGRPVSASPSRVVRYEGQSLGVSP